MRKLSLLSIFLLPMAVSANNATSNVITCFDVTNDIVSLGARSALHKEAQQRAQKNIEEFIGKPVLTPYFDGMGQPAKAQNMASVIEVFWCEERKKPLHSAYYDFYSRNKNAFNLNQSYELKNNHIIYNLDDYYPTKKGWTYILLSRNKKYMKIGKSVAVLENRIKNIKNDLNYKQFDFDFHLAIDDCYYEQKLFSVFSEYRACCFWKEGKIKSKPLTSKEINKRVSLKVEEFNSNSSYVGRHEIYRKFVLITRLELFKIPPRKVAPKIKDIVRDYLDKECSLNG